MINMRLKKVLSLVTAISTMLVTSSYQIAFAESDFTEIPDVTPESKISEELKEQMETKSNTRSERVYPVVVWHDNVSDSEVENEISNEVGYDISDLEVTYQVPSNDLLDELQQAANDISSEKLEILMQDYMQLTEESRQAEKEKTDEYQSARLDVIEDMIKTNTQNTLEELNISDENVVFASRYAPMSICLLTQEEIVAASENDNVDELTLYKPVESEECAIDLGTTTNTMGIDRINNDLSLTGKNVSIGIYETGTVSSAYYSAFGVRNSQVTIVGSPYSSGSHSTYCAGIAAGSNGVAPDANIYSASCEYDWQKFNWNEYDKAALSSLEELIDRGVDVISISWGASNSKAGYDNWAKYIDYLIANSGTTIVCATGNTYSDYIMSPSTAYNCIAVNGFIDNYNGTSSNILNDYSYNNGDGCLKPDVVGPSLNNGTSTATPYIAGMIALMYQYKPSLAAFPELTKAILIGSCHQKCQKILLNGELSDHLEAMTSGLTNYQGAGIPNLYRMISIVSQHCYGNGSLSANNGYERDVHFVQPSNNSSYINVSMAYLQTNVPTDTASGVKDDCDLELKNNSITSRSSKATSSTEMIYKKMSSDSDYTMKIYKYSGKSTKIKYAYAWSTDTDIYYPSTEMDGMYLLQNYNSNMYLSLNTSNSKAYQDSFDNAVNSKWILSVSSATSGTYWAKNASTSGRGIGVGSAISNNNYYALDDSTSATSPITLQFNKDSGTYTLKRIVNGATYALGISNNSTASGAYANWQPYSANNKSQKWYLETINTRPGDINLDGNINNTDVTLLNKYLSGSVSLSGNMQKYMADVNRDGEINSLDAVLLQQILLEI